MKEEIIKELEKKGVYFTHLVKELVNVFIKAKKPLSIREIIKNLNKLNFFPYQSSLYRQLSRLSGLKIVEKILFSDGVIRYFFILKGKHFCHFRCQRCGYIESILTKEKITSNRHFKKNIYAIISNSITFEGICSKCRKIKK